MNFLQKYEEKKHEAKIIEKEKINFKIGDVVKIIRPTYYIGNHNDFIFKGYTAEVMKVNNKGDIQCMICAIQKVMTINPNFLIKIS